MDTSARRRLGAGRRVLRPAPTPQVGSGRLAWLPHHKYLIELTVEVHLDDALTGRFEPKSIRQALQFHTRGLPGLNAVRRTGDELEPYVEAVYGGTRQRPTYRAEPVAVVFSEDFEILAPGQRTDTQRTQPEQRQVLEWVLAVDRIGDPDGHRTVSRTADEWLSAQLNRNGGPGLLTDEGRFEDGRFVEGSVAWVERQAKTRDPYRQRLHDMASRPGGCGGEEEPLQPSKVLLHRPHDPDHPDADLWAPNREHRAAVRLRNAPFLDRPRFQISDLPGLRFGRSSGAAEPWDLDGEGWLAPESGFAAQTYALVGDRTWDRVTVRTRVDVQAGTAGIGVSLHEDMGVLDGLVAEVGADGRLVIMRRESRSVSRVAGPADITTVGDEPVELEVTLFDDKLRAVVGETQLEVERGHHRGGTVGLFLDGHGRFDGLRIHGLEAYAFRFHTSRFASLEEHLSSHGGRLHTVRPGAMGLSSASISGVFRDTAARLRELARTDDPMGRQEVFDTWTQRLALPWRERPLTTEISRFGEGNEAQALLVESPEAFPFGDELRPRLTSGGPPLGPRRHHPLAVVSDGPQLRAILIPLRDGHTRPQPLDSGRYDFRLSLNRERFRSAVETQTSNRVEAGTTTLTW